MAFELRFEGQWGLRRGGDGCVSVRACARAFLGARTHACQWYSEQREHQRPGPERRERGTLVHLKDGLCLGLGKELA